MSSFEIQNQVRGQVELMKKNLQDQKEWEKEMKLKEIELKQKLENNKVRNNKEFFEILC